MLRARPDSGALRDRVEREDVGGMQVGTQPKSTRLRRALLVCVLAVLSLVGVDVASAQRVGEPSGGFARGDNPYSVGRPKAITQPGQFDYYVLALSWSPSYCASLPRDGYDPQCHRRDGKRYSFVLHGLWPQFERGWPESCPSPDRGFVPRPVAQRMLDIMPSDKLVFHEYRKHGTCSGLGVDGYFDMARRLHDKVRIPARFQNVTDPRLQVSPGELVKDFLAANPNLPPDALAVECGGPGSRLKEVRVCFDRQGEFRSCGRNEDQRRLCAAERMYVPPVREGAGDPARAPSLRDRLRQLVPGSGQRI
jgi:ribonuclease T2